MRQFFLWAAVVALTECRPSHYHSRKLIHPLSTFHLPTTTNNGANAENVACCTRNHRDGTCRTTTKRTGNAKSTPVWVTNIPRGGQWRDDDRDDDDQYQSQQPSYYNRNNNNNDYYADPRDDGRYDGRYDGDYDDRGGYHDDPRPSVSAMDKLWGV
jgi:hypothetical protein